MPQQTEEEILRQFGGRISQESAEDEALRRLGGTVGGPATVDPYAISKFDKAAGIQNISIPMYNYPVDPATGQRTQTPQAITHPQGNVEPLSTLERLFVGPLSFLGGGGWTPESERTLEAQRQGQPPPFLQYPKAGVGMGGTTQLGYGLHGLAHPESGEQFFGSAADVIEGGFTGVATPFAVPAAWTNPLATGIGLGTFAGLQQGAEAGGRLLGIPEGYNRFLGNLIGIYGGAKVHGWINKLGEIPDQRVANTIFQRTLAASEALNDPSISPAERAATKAGLDAMIGSMRQGEQRGMPGFFEDVRATGPAAGIGPTPGMEQPTSPTGLQGTALARYLYLTKVERKDPTAAFQEVLRGAATRATTPSKLRPGVTNVLTPQQQSSQRFLTERGIRTPLSMQTGSKAAAALEGTTQNLPGGGRFHEQMLQSQEQLRASAPELFQQIYPEQLTSEEVGSGIQETLRRNLENRRDELARHIHPEPVTPGEVGAGIQQTLGRRLQETRAGLAEEVFPGTPMTPESAGSAVLDRGKQEIRNLDQAADKAYQAAWLAEQHPGNIESVPSGELDPRGRPVMVNMALPIDMRPLQRTLKPLLAKYEYTLTETKRRDSPGVNIMRQIIAGDRFKPASAAETDLGMLKDAARTEKGLKELRDVSQGMAAKAVAELQNAIDAKVANAAYPGWSPESGTASPALENLRAGRRTTAQKYDVADTFERFGRNIEEVEPVAAYGRMTWTGDAGIQHLRELARIAPEQMPMVGRAFIEGGGNWESLGPETKKILFKDPGIIKGLDEYYAKEAKFGPLLGIEPVALFERLAAKGGKRINLLRDLLTEAPEHRAQIGRAFVESGSNWGALDAETKNTLFRGDRALIASLDELYANQKRFGPLLNLEPGVLFDRVTAPGGTRINLAQDIAFQTPQHKAQIARTFVEGLFDRATREGDIRKAQSTLDAYLDLDPKTKATLIEDPKMRQELEDLFVSMKRIIANPNPSGSGLLAALNQMKGNIFKGLGAILGGGGGYAGHGAPGLGPAAGAGFLAGAGIEYGSNALLARLLFNQRFINLLNRGFREASRGNTAGAKLAVRSLESIISENLPESPPPGQAPAGSAGEGPAPVETPGLGQRIKEGLKEFWESEEGTMTLPPGAGPEGDYTRHLPPPAGEPQSPFKPLQPPEIRRGGKLEGSLHELRRSQERAVGVGGPDNQRTVFRDKDGEFVVGKLTPQDWIQRVRGNLSADEMVRARRWYRELEGFFNEQFGEEEGPKMALAWLSSQQNVSPSGGMMNVMRALDQLRGMPKEKIAGLAEAKILAALKGEIPAEGYDAKLHDFVDSALGKTTRTWMGDDPRGGQPAVIDVWANRDVGKIDQKVLDYLTERFGAKAVKNLKLDGKSIGETDYDYGSKFYNQLVEHLNKTNFDGGGWTGDQVQAVGWTAMQKAMGDVPEFASDLITKNTRQYAYEIQPGEGAPVLRQYPWHTLPQDQQAKITEYIGTRVTDLAAKLTGSKITNRTVGLGAYQGKPTVSIQMDVFGSPESFRDFARASAYLGQQTEVWHVRPLKSGDSWAYFVRGEGLNTPELKHQFWEKLRDKVGEDLVPGYSPMSGDTGHGVYIVNPFNKQYLAERLKAGLKTPETMRYWTAGDKAKIDAGIDAVEKEMGLDLVIDFDKVDLGASLHNWAGKRKTNGHLQGLVKTGRSAISDELLSHAPDSLRWWKEAWDQFAGGATPGESPGATGPQSPSEAPVPEQGLNPLEQAVEQNKAAIEQRKKRLTPRK